MKRKYTDEEVAPLMVESYQEGRKQGRAYLTDILHRNYEATKRRGLIDEKTTVIDFTDKVVEETNELLESLNSDGSFDHKELADIALVCFAMAQHYGIDLIEEMRIKTEFNETRL